MVECGLASLRNWVTHLPLPVQSTQTIQMTFDEKGTLLKISQSATELKTQSVPMIRKGIYLSCQAVNLTRGPDLGATDVTTTTTNKHTDRQNKQAEFRRTNIRTGKKKKRNKSPSTTSDRYPTQPAHVNESR